MKEEKKEGRKDPLRKSCDYCARMKRACDGLDPCELCLRRRKECTRSVKRKSGPAKGAKYAPRRNKREVGSAQAGSQASGMNKEEKWRGKRHVAGVGVREEDAERRVAAPNSGFETPAGDRGCSDVELSFGPPAARGDCSSASAQEENGETSGGNGEPGIGPRRKGDRDDRTTRGGGTQPATAEASTLSSCSSSSPSPPLFSGQSGASTENGERVTGCHPGVNKEDHSSAVSGEPVKGFSGSESSASRSDLPSSAMELDSGRVEAPASHPRKATKRRASDMTDSEAVGSRGADSSLVERNGSFGDRAPGGVGILKDEGNGRMEDWAKRSSSKLALAEGERDADRYSGRVNTAPSSSTFPFAGSSSRASDKPQAYDERSQALSRLSSEKKLQSRDDGDGNGSGKSEDPSGRDGGRRKAPSRDEIPLQSEESGRFAARKRGDTAAEETSTSPRCAGSESEGAPPSDARPERFGGAFSAPDTSMHGIGERCSSTSAMKQEEPGLPPLNHFWDRSTAAGRRADEIDRYVRRSIGQSVFQRNFSAPLPLPPKDLLRMLRPNDYDVIDAIAERSGSVSDGESRATFRVLPRTSSAPERSNPGAGFVSDVCGGKSTEKPPSKVTGGGGCLVLPSVDLVGRGAAVKKEVDDRFERGRKWMPVNEAEARYWRELWDYPPGELGLPLGSSGLRGGARVSTSGDGRHGSAPNEAVERDFRGSRIAREVLKREGQQWGDRGRCGNGGRIVGDDKGGGGLGRHSSAPSDGVPAENGKKHLWICEEKQAAGNEEEDSHRRSVGGAEACLRKEDSAGGLRPERVSPGRGTGFDAGGDTRNGGTRQGQEGSFRRHGEVAARETTGGDGGTMRREGDTGNSTVEQVVERDGDPPCFGKKSHESNRPYNGGVGADIMELCGDRAGSVRDFRRDAADKRQNPCMPSGNEAGKNKATGDVVREDGSARHGSKGDGDGVNRDGSNFNSSGHCFREGMRGVIIEGSQNAEYRGVNRINSASSAASSVASSCSNSIQSYDASRAERNDTVKSVAEMRGGSDHDRDFFRSRLIGRGGVGPIGSPPTQVQDRPGPELLACLRTGRDPGMSARYHEPYRRPPKVEEETATPPRPGLQHVERAATIPCKAEPPESWSRRPCDPDEGIYVGRLQTDRRSPATVEASVLIPGGVSMPSPWRNNSSWFPKDDRGRSRFPVEVEDENGNGPPSSSLQIIRGGVTDGSGKGDQGYGWVRGQGSIPRSRCNVSAVGERDPRGSVDDGVEGVRTWGKEGKGDVWNGRWRADWGPLLRGVRNGEFCKQGVGRFPVGRRVEEED